MKETKEFNRDIFTSFVKYIDNHLIAIRYSITATGIIGLIIIGRSGRLLTKFKNVKEIPDRFVMRHIKLQGFIRDVDNSGNLKIEHQRLITLPFLNSHKENLNISLAGICLQDEGISYLRKNFVSEKVWFRLMNRNNDSESMNCILMHKPSFWKLVTNINEDVVKKGLAFPNKFDETDAVWSRLNKRLERAENIAKKKKAGVWKVEELSFFEKFSDYIPANPLTSFFRKRSP